jgi:hypothetical protein
MWIVGHDDSSLDVLRGASPIHSLSLEVSRVRLSEETTWRDKGVATEQCATKSMRSDEFGWAIAGVSALA